MADFQICIIVPLNICKNISKIFRNDFQQTKTKILNKYSIHPAVKGYFSKLTNNYLIEI